ncbi:MAG: acetyl-CoA carboxylase, carboxyltransferase subunit beta [Clostridiales bacterium]|jgi:acetyl-CoA carboxylase carboxyl transferase beta subunit|nr:acetyl-CoA carboxylase, carboxyltransferase subunit beta [Clostridiales bacterium]
MDLKALFKKAGNTLEGGVRIVKKRSSTMSCPRCGSEYDKDSVLKNHWACPRCGGYFRMSARRRLRFLCDEDTFREFDKELATKDILEFPGYPEKLAKSAEKCGQKEGVLCGECKIGGYDTCIFIMEPDFMMGSMGSVVGEKITRLFEYATEQHLPVVGCTVSGGARMQEGIVSLMQMAKVSGAVKRHSDRRNFYLTVITNPTTGGVTASFAMQGDVIIAEPGALIGFAGPRVIEQTIRQNLPKGFQRSDFLLSHGFLDAVVPRQELKEFIIKMLRIHA